MIDALRCYILCEILRSNVTTTQVDFPFIYAIGDLNPCLTLPLLLAMIIGTLHMYATWIWQEAVFVAAGNDSLFLLVQPKRSNGCLLCDNASGPLADAAGSELAQKYMLCWGLQFYGPNAYQRANTSPWQSCILGQNCNANAGQAEEHYGLVRTVRCQYKCNGSSLVVYM